MKMANEITEVTRRNIIDYLVASGISWTGWLPEDEFLFSQQTVCTNATL
jgi:hypothetical protein